jgi:2-iminoacetate synthase
MIKTAIVEDEEPAFQTLKEYLEDYASPDTKTAGEKLISQELKTFKNLKTAEDVSSKLDKIHAGERDFRY